ncbi:hypothetical protein LZ554_008446 [Drepanopeziza brunnea f. sp. 'monogermtubi']|nr:hypothetical protein LZ554_008446 [Drepanopeziza brunnea f. sp. 'monogermtubi']
MKLKAKFNQWRLGSADANSQAPPTTASTKTHARKLSKSIQARVARQASSIATLGSRVGRNEKRGTEAAVVATDRDLSVSATTAATLNLSLVNRTSSNNVNAYVTGLAIDNSYRFVLIQSDGRTPYYPSSPSSVGSPLAVNCAIPLGPPGSSKIVTIPRIAGGRIWFSIDSSLTFRLNPGPGLVEPSVSNPSDPNYKLNWGFCEFTFNNFQLFANISYVDFVSIPIALNLINTAGAKQSVIGIPKNGLQRVVQGLIDQNAKDGKGWDKLVVRASNGSVLRALSPNTGIVMDSSLFQGYYDAYVNAIWDKYSRAPLTVDTQAQWGTVSAYVSNNLLTFANIGSFAKPSAKDIFSCSTGPFAAYPVNTDAMGNLTARLAAGLNRSTLLEVSKHPAESLRAYYQGAGGVTNHYSRVVHAVNGDGRGYAFPYDDVGASGSQDLAGAVSDGAPKILEVVVGGY